MSGIFPLRETVNADNRGEPRLVDLDDDVADEVFEALSSKTTRKIFMELHESPQAASDLAKVTDTSVQNVQYHLEKLVEADLVEVVDTWYSERGTEMKVYAPTDESLVLFAGDDKSGSLRTLLKSVIGVLAALLPVSILVGLATRLLGSGSDPTGQYTGSGGGDGPSVAADGGTPTEGGFSVQDTTGGGDVGVASNESGSLHSATPEPSTTPEPSLIDGVIDGGADLLSSAGSDPAVVGAVAFFLGGAFVLAMLWAVYWRR